MHHPANRTERFWRGWGLAVLGATIVVGLAVLPPFVDPGWRAALMQAFAGVCHQLAERSPHMHGVQLAVCDRCFGLYIGLFAGTLAYPFCLRWDATLRRQLGPILLLAVLPAAIDWGGDFLGLWLNTPVSRLVTGGLFGVAAGVCLARALSGGKEERASPFLSFLPHKKPL